MCCVRFTRTLAERCGSVPDGGGLAWLEGGRLQVVNSQQGLGDDVISQILEDDQENLWLGCHRGIFRVSKHDLRAVAAGRVPAVHPLALDEADGMLAAECTGGYSPAGLRSESGILYFSTVRGVVAVDPKMFRLLDGHAARGAHRRRPSDGNPLPRSSGPLNLPPGPRELEIHYTAFNYSKPEQIRFRHRLQGVAKDAWKWTNAGHERAVRLSLLPPGDYTLQVSAANADGRWSEPGAGLAFSVAPFFWQTAWFRAGVTLLVMAIGGASRGSGRARVTNTHSTASG